MEWRTSTSPSEADASQCFASRSFVACDSRRRPTLRPPDAGVQPTTPNISELLESNAGASAGNCPGRSVWRLDSSRRERITSAGFHSTLLHDVSSLDVTPGRRTNPKDWGRNLKTTIRISELTVELEVFSCLGSSYTFLGHTTTLFPMHTQSFFQSKNCQPSMGIGFSLSGKSQLQRLLQAETLSAREFDAGCIHSEPLSMCDPSTPRLKRLALVCLSTQSCSCQGLATKSVSVSCLAHGLSSSLGI